MAICGPEEYYFGRSDIVMNPVLIFEVLSDSTAAWDRGGKFRQYEMIPALKEYVIVEQEGPQIDVFRRNEEGHWVLERYDGLEATVQFKSVGVDIPSEKIYYGIKFEQSSAESTQ